MKALIVALILGLAVPAISFYDNETDCSKWYDDNASVGLCRKSIKLRNGNTNNHDENNGSPVNTNGNPKLKQWD
jgi:hypothetical protein